MIPQRNDIRLMILKHTGFILLSLLAGWLWADLVQAAETNMGHIGADIFAKRSKWWHGYISLSESYDDNIFNADEDVESDCITVISPGFQVTIPGTDHRAEEIVTGTTAPGGLVFGRFRNTGFRRFRAYLGYAPQLEFYADHPEENIINHGAQAGLSLNFRSGLTLNAVDRLDRNHDQLEADTSTQDTAYLSNLVTLSAAFPFTPKLRVRTDYSHFNVAYAIKEKSSYRDRADNTATGYLYFEIRPKTDLFLSYQYTDISYDTETVRNSVEQDYTGGLRYDLTSKTNLYLQAGYGRRVYDDADVDDNQRLICRARLNYAFSGETDFGLTLYRLNEESSISTYTSTITTAANLALCRALTHKVTISLDTTYKHLDYDHIRDSEPADIGDRTDTRIIITPALSYSLNKCLTAALSYSQRRLESDLELNSYTGQRIMLKITGSI